MSFLTRSFRGLVGSFCVAAAVVLPLDAQVGGRKKDWPRHPSGGTQP